MIKLNKICSFIPTAKFENCVIRGNLDSGTNITFTNPNVYFDMPFFSENKIYDNRHSDLIIELVAFSDETNLVECIFCTFCKVYPESGGKTYKIKPEMQKLKVNNTWFDIQDIFGFTSENNECEICCTNKKNTIFLPCKHSYACKDCAILIRIKGNNCPICRQCMKFNFNFNIVFLAISDSVVIENIESIEQSNP